MSITVNTFLCGSNSFSKVYGSGTSGARGTTALFTACRSRTIFHQVDGGAFLTGKIGVLHGVRTWHNYFFLS